MTPGGSVFYETRRASFICDFCSVIPTPDPYQCSVPGIAPGLGSVFGTAVFYPAQRVFE